MTDSAIQWPWQSTYPSHIRWDATVISAPLYRMMDYAAHFYPNNPAFNFMGKVWTWGEIGALTTRMAKGLHSLGVEKGSRVGLFLPNTPYFLIAYYAIAKTGGTIVNYNPLYAEREIAAQIEDSGTDLMITLDLKVVYDKIEKMLHSTRLNQLIVCPFEDLLPFPKNKLFKLLKRHDIARIRNDDRHIFFSHVIDNDGEFAPPPCDPDNDIALLQYTGGTTGIPKGAMLTHTNITSNVDQIIKWFPDLRAGQDKMLGVIPFFHVFAMTAVMNLSVKLGLEIIALPKFDLAETLKLIDREKPTIFPAVPAIYNAINNAANLEKYNLKSLRYCVSGGAPLPVEVKKTFEDLTGCIVVEGYGLTETSPVVCVNPTMGENKAGSIGMPLPGTIVELLDPQTHKNVHQGERGEVCVRGPQVMKGYWNRPDETAKTMMNGRLHTGDIAVMDEEGYFFIVDRIKDLILVNGYNVYPRMVEEAIYMHPGVEECIVAGVKDAERGEVPKAWIKLRSGYQVTEQDLKMFLKDKISPIEVPRHFEFRAESLPKTMIGKLSKKDVLAQESQQKNTKESGSVLFIVLITAMLFAALTYAFTKSGRISEGGVIQENVRSQASVIANYVTQLRQEVARLQAVNDCRVQNIDWRHDVYKRYNGSLSNMSGDTAPPAPKTGCALFVAYGGTITPQLFPNAKDEEYEAYMLANNTGSHVSGHAALRWVNKVDAGTSANDIAITFQGIDKDICRYLLNPANPQTAIPADAYTLPYNANQPNALITGANRIEAAENLRGDFFATEVVMGSGTYCHLGAILLPQ